MFRQAMLVQDIAQLRAMIDPYIQKLLESFIHSIDELNVDHLVEWIIKEELWRSYQLTAEGHWRNQLPESRIYHHVRGLLVKPTLEEIIQHFIRAPRLYGDAQIRVEVKGRDLYIYYYLNQQLHYPS